VIKKRLLIVFGSSSILCRNLIPKLSPFDMYLFLSTKDQLEPDLLSGQINVKLEKVSVDGICDAFKNELGLKRSDLGEICVISFAGVSDRTIFKDLSQSEIDQVLNINLRSNVYLTSAVLKYFGVGSTSMVFLSSTRALLGDRGLTLYSATKHALSGLVKGISLEYGRFGFRANVLSIGVAPVGLVDKVPEKRLTEILKRSASGKMVEIDSIVQCLENLRSNRGLSGSTHFCDGGYY
jgi:NAD(P)-dependent dehydrogenase (short-subunit alcohol dehydrogenase family)